MRRLLDQVKGWVFFAVFIVVIVGLSILFQMISEAGEEAGGIIGFLADWFFG